MRALEGRTNVSEISQIRQWSEKCSTVSKNLLIDTCKYARHRSAQSSELSDHLSAMFSEFLSSI